MMGHQKLAPPGLVTCVGKATGLWDFRLVPYGPCYVRVKGRQGYSGLQQGWTL